ncbi:Lipoxygenasey PLAT domains 1 [Balamuthia mandrillaris]
MLQRRPTKIEEGTRTKRRREGENDGEEAKGEKEEVGVKEEFSLEEGEEESNNSSEEEGDGEEESSSSEEGEEEEEEEEEEERLCGAPTKKGTFCKFLARNCRFHRLKEKDM